jgi:hypothetical protein
VFRLTDKAYCLFIVVTLVEFVDSVNILSGVCVCVCACVRACVRVCVCVSLSLSLKIQHIVHSPINL